eukprot:GHVP01020592.1.p1 GENE.GHVP01020592.1~~GHVP01020592.1.p1  ORF type:complete len:1177 (+),score=236.75 GHVP01020592.1:489-3533(+)
MKKWGTNVEPELLGSDEILDEEFLRNNKKIETWDQFSVNEKKFEVRSTYKEEYYTTPIDLSKFTEDQKKGADKLAEEIDKEHRTQGRGGDSLVNDQNPVDEEFQFSSVNTKAGPQNTVTQPTGRYFPGLGYSTGFQPEKAIMSHSGLPKVQPTKKHTFGDNKNTTEGSTLTELPTGSNVLSQRKYKVFDGMAIDAPKNELRFSHHGKQKQNLSFKQPGFAIPSRDTAKKEFSEANENLKRSIQQQWPSPTTAPGATVTTSAATASTVATSEAAAVETTAPVSEATVPSAPTLPGAPSPAISTAPLAQSTESIEKTQKEVVLTSDNQNAESALRSSSRPTISRFGSFEDPGNSQLRKNFSDVAAGGVHPDTSTTGSLKIGKPSTSFRLNPNAAAFEPTFASKPDSTSWHSETQIPEKLQPIVIADRTTAPLKKTESLPDNAVKPIIPLLSSVTPPTVSAASNGISVKGSTKPQTESATEETMPSKQEPIASSFSPFSFLKRRSRVCSPGEITIMVKRLLNTAISEVQNSTTDLQSCTAAPLWGPLELNKSFFECTRCPEVVPNYPHPQQLHQLAMAAEIMPSEVIQPPPQQTVETTPQESTCPSPSATIVEKTVSGSQMPGVASADSQQRWPFVRPTGAPVPLRHFMPYNNFMRSNMPPNVYPPSVQMGPGPMYMPQDVAWHQDPTAINVPQQQHYFMQAKNVAGKSMEESPILMTGVIPSGVSQASPEQQMQQQQIKNQKRSPPIWTINRSSTPEENKDDVQHHPHHQQQKPSPITQHQQPIMADPRQPMMSPPSMLQAMTMLPRQPMIHPQMPMSQTPQQMMTAPTSVSVVPGKQQHLMSQQSTPQMPVSPSPGTQVLEMQQHTSLPQGYAYPPAIGTHHSDFYRTSIGSVYPQTIKPPENEEGPPVMLAHPGRMAPTVEEQQQFLQQQQYFQQYFYDQRLFYPSPGGWNLVPQTVYPQAPPATVVSESQHGIHTQQNQTPPSHRNQHLRRDQHLIDRPQPIDPRHDQESSWS